MALTGMTGRLNPGFDYLFPIAFWALKSLFMTWKK